MRGQPGGQRLVPRRRDLLSLAPYNADHWAAVRVGLANAVPLLVLWAIGHQELSIYAVFGAFTSVYARNLPHLSRLRLQAVAGLSMAVSIALGALIALSPERNLLIVPIAAVWAAGASLLGDRTRWTPPGPLFQIFGIAAIAAIPSTPAHALQGVAVAVAVVLWSLLIGYSGRIVRRLSSRIPPSARAGRPLPPPPYGSAVHAWQFGIGTLVAGAIPTIIGIGHPYWAMVSVVAGLSAMSVFQRVLRAAHRFLGTLLGLALGGLILLFHPDAFATVIIVIALTALIELVVLRNYSLAMTFMTPMVLLMGSLAGPIDEGQLLFQRAVETLIGVVVAVAIALIAGRFRTPRALDQ